MSQSPWDVLASAITRLTDKVNAMPSAREATVAAVSPLSVMFDTDTTVTLVRGTLTGSLNVGDRVLTIKLRHYVWILGVKSVYGTFNILNMEVANTADIHFLRIGNRIDGHQGDGHLLFRATTDDASEYTDFQFLLDGTIRTRTGAGTGPYRNLPFAMASGVLAAVTVGAGAAVNTAVTFPGSRFTVPPVVVAAGNQSVRDITVYADGITATGFTLVRGSNSSASRSPGAIWIAMQQTPTAASG